MQCRTRMLLGAAAIFVAACGGDSGSDSGGEPRPLADLRDAAWDATITQGSQPVHTVANVTGDLRAWFGELPDLPFGRLSFEGPLSVDGSATLTGHFEGSDFIILHEGAATATRQGDLQRVTGTLTRFRDPAYEFELTYEPGRRPERFSGAHTIELTSTSGVVSTIPVDLAIDPDGRGRFDATVETDAGTGAPIADLADGVALVAPSGTVELRSSYETRAPGCPITAPELLVFTSNGQCTLILRGTLSETEPSGGRFRVDATSAEFVLTAGTWTARR